MNTVPKSAFGYTVFLVDTVAGEERDVNLTDNGYAASGHYFYTKGRMRNQVIETGEQLEDRIAGWLNTENPNKNASSSGTVRAEFVEDSQWLCIPRKFNNDNLPNLSSLILPAGETQVLENGTNLYLVRGQLDINGRIFNGPAQIRVRSDNVTVTSIGDTAYSLKFL